MMNSCIAMLTCKQYTFLEANELGTSQPRQCGTCVECRCCSIWVQMMSSRGAAELVMVDKAMRFDEALGFILFNYPFI